MGALKGRLEPPYKLCHSSPLSQILSESVFKWKDLLVCLCLWVCKLFYFFRICSKDFVQTAAWQGTITEVKSLKLNFDTQNPFGPNGQFWPTCGPSVCKVISQDLLKGFFSDCAAWQGWISWKQLLKLNFLKNPLLGLVGNFGTIVTQITQAYISQDFKMTHSHNSGSAPRNF